MRLHLVRWETVLALAAWLAVVSAAPDASVKVLYTRGAAPGGQVLVTWNPFALFPNDFVSVRLISASNIDSFTSSRDGIASSAISSEKLTRNDGQFELKLPYSVREGSYVVAVSSPSRHGAYGASRKPSVSAAFEVHSSGFSHTPLTEAPYVPFRPGADYEERRERREREREKESEEGKKETTARPTMPEGSTIILTEPTSQLYVSAESVPVRWSTLPSYKGPIELEVWKARDPRRPGNGSDRVAFYHVANTGAMDLNMANTACEGYYYLVIRQGAHPRDEAKSRSFQLDTRGRWSNADRDPSSSCQIEPRLKQKRAQGADGEDGGYEEDDSASKWTDWFQFEWLKEWWGKLSRWQPSPTEVVYIVTGAVVAVALVTFLVMCCCSCCRSKRFTAYAENCHPNQRRSRRRRRSSTGRSTRQSSVATTASSSQPSPQPVPFPSPMLDPEHEPSPRARPAPPHPTHPWLPYMTRRPWPPTTLQVRRRLRHRCMRLSPRIPMSRRVEWR